MTDMHDTGPQPRSPWTRPGFLASLGFALVVVLLGVAVIANSKDSDSAGAAPGPTAAAGRRPSTPPARDKGACPSLADTDQRIPQAAPPVQWALVYTVTVPSSADAGPAVTEGDVARCYAHTPTGALLAAAQITARYVWAPGWAQVTERQTTGEGRDAYLRERKKIEATSGPLTPEKDRHGQLAGYKFVTYSEATAVVQMVHRFTDGHLVMTPVTVLWQGGDWVLSLPSSPAPQVTLASLQGYVPFGGV